MSGGTPVRPVVVGVALALPAVAAAQSNVDAVAKRSWHENTGWTNWRDAAGTQDGVVVRDDHLEGFVWIESAGWLNVGPGGGPYANDPTDGSTFGVNIRGDGFLSGLGWAENLGWVQFDTRDALGDEHAARFDDAALRFRGFVWSDNAGWINLDGTEPGTFVALACPGDATGDRAVDLADLNLVLASFDSKVEPGTSGDVTGDGVVDLADLNLVLANWDQSCT